MGGGLRTVFSGPSRYPRPDHLDEFEDRVDDLRSGGWTSIGTLIRNGNPFFWGGQARRMPDLPEEVDHISLGAHKLLPSLIAITADVFLTDTATDHVRRIQEGFYLPEMSFRYWNPRRWLHGSTTKPSESISGEAVLLWIDGLRSRVETLLEPFFKGQFLSQRVVSRSRLPAIETYYLVNVPLGPGLAPWKGSARNWWRSLGFGSGMNSYEGTQRTFSWPDDGFRVARLCVPKPAPEERFSAANNEDILNRILPVFAVLQLLDSLETDFARLRRRMYQRVMFGVRARRLQREILSAHELSRRSLVLNRLQVEFEDARAHIAHRARRLSDMVNAVTPNAPPLTLDVALMEGIDWRLRIVQQHVKLLTQAFSEHVSILNSWVAFKLQRALFWLTVVYTILAFIAVVATWPQLIVLWGKVNARMPHSLR